MTIAREVDAGGIATLVLDDGRVNAFDAAFFAALDAAFDACAEDAAVVVAGRHGVFSAGLDRRVIDGGDDDAIAALLVAFGRSMLRVWTEPRPVVAAATGHAVAGGTILAMACDHAVAAAGDHRWGLVETTIGFPIPRFVLEIAARSVRADRLDDLVLPGALVGPDAAVEAGFADVAVPVEQVVALAQDRARELAALPRPAYAATKARLRGDAAERAGAGLVDDVRALLAERMPPPRG